MPIVKDGLARSRARPVRDDRHFRAYDPLKGGSEAGTDGGIDLGINPTPADDAASRKTPRRGAGVDPDEATTGP